MHTATWSCFNPLLFNMNRKVFVRAIQTQIMTDKDIYKILGIKSQWRWRYGNSFQNCTQPSMSASSSTSSQVSSHAFTDDWSTKSGAISSPMEMSISSSSTISSAINTVGSQQKIKL